MKHPEVILIPLLMFADYMLTVLGARQRETGYAQHFKLPSYELNPVWQKAIAQKRWFNLRHMILTLIISGALIFVVGFGDVPDIFSQMLLGAILTLYGFVLGRHLSNLLIFRRVRRFPNEISGEVTMTQSFVTALSLHQSLQLIIPIIILAVLSRNGYVLGGAIGVLVFMLVNSVWLQRAKATPKPPTTS